MTKEQCKQKILAEWETWAKDPNTATYDDKQMFYLWLEQNRPELLTWQLANPGMDRWQDVQGWLNRRTGYGKTP